MTRHYARLWRQGLLSTVTEQLIKPPDKPARDTQAVKMVSPRDMPRLGKAGNLSSRQALVHSLVHTESWAVDLAWDALARFGADPAYDLPAAFFDDFIQIADDEAKHFQLLQARLQELGSSYGALPAHDGLWESAARTAHSLPARLAVEHCVHEGRGLDVLPQTIQRFRSSGDGETAALLGNVILQEEVQHCAAGVRWLKWLFASRPPLRPLPASSAPASPQNGQHQAASLRKPAAVEAHEPAALSAHATDEIGSEFTTVEAWFHHLVREHFHGHLKPPFNKEARTAAGFTEDWYLPLTAAAAAAAAADAVRTLN
ncbi:hypothetical protein WJX73_003807 [Symbiochloris irregularis]|uniref:Uncharacterized protein n=1 Tax=Symbiochloris irregularis TaxID=706552 RepID=A0AAW1NSQ9_9CHLO